MAAQLLRRLFHRAEAHNDFGLDRSPLFPFTTPVVTCHNKTFIVLLRQTQVFFRQIFVAANLEDQVKEIEAVCSRLGIDYKQLADAAGINRETMRKYAMGYQPMPDDKRSALKLVEDIRRLQNDHGTLHDRPSKDNPAATYSLLETDTLMRSLADLAGKLPNLTHPERLIVLTNLVAMINELRNREFHLTRMSPELQEIADGSAAVAHQRALRATRESKQSSPTDGTTGHKSHEDPGNKPPKPAVRKPKADESEGQGKAHT